MSLRKTIIFAIGLALAGLFVGLQSKPTSAIDCSSRIVKYMTSDRECAAEAQRLLQVHGFYTMKIDGLFGTGSVDATKRFQSSRQIKPDGIIGSVTWGKLYALPAPTPTPAPAPAPTKDCSNVIVKYNTTDIECAKEAQRLLQLRGWYTQNIDGKFGPASVNAAMNFQRSQYISDDGIIGPATWARLKSPQWFDTSIPGSLPSSCKTSGTVLCASKPLRKLVLLKNGVVQKVADARFGGFTNDDFGGYRNFPTVSGTYWVYKKDATAYSDRWESSMPYSIIFNPNMYVHQSGNFARVGYDGSSHGCINIRTLTEAKWFYDNTPIGAKVVIY